MKRFLKKRLLGIPVGAILVLLLVGVVAAAGYTFLSFTTTVYVDEPLLVEYNLEGRYGGDNEWRSLGEDPESLTVWGSAGDTFDIALRIWNRASGSLEVTTVVTGNTGYLILTGLPDGTIQASTLDDTVPEWTGTMTLKIRGDTPPSMGDGYSLTISFIRS